MRIHFQLLFIVACMVLLPQGTHARPLPQDIFSAENPIATSTNIPSGDGGASTTTSTSPSPTPSASPSVTSTAGSVSGGGDNPGATAPPFTPAPTATPPADIASTYLLVLRSAAMRNFTGSVSNITSQIFAANNGGNAPPVSDVTALVAAANSSSPNAPTGAIAAALARRDLRGGKNKVLHTYDDLGVVSVQLTPSMLAKMPANPSIAAIIKDDLVKVSGSIVKQGNVSNWGLTRISSRINNIDTSTDYTYDSTGGKGVTIFVVDTGVETNNPEFEGRAIPGREFCTGCPPVKSAEDTLHGTAVAAIAASKTYGVAKKAKIVSVRAMSGEGYGRWSDVIAALQWIKANANRSPYRSSLGAIVNLSIEGPVNGVVNRMIAQVQRAGIQVVIAAGNNAEDACITSPASATAMFDGNNGPISVAASDATDSMAYFTNFGSCVDVIAPGDSVTTIYDMVVSGTSFAAPAVAGTMALYMSANPWLGTPSMRAWIRYRATKDLIQGTTSDTPNLLLYNTLQGK